MGRCVKAIHANMALSFLRAAAEMDRSVETISELTGRFWVSSQQGSSARFTGSTIVMNVVKDNAASVGK